MVKSDGLLEIFTAIRGRIARVVLRIVPPEEVEDIVQETYVRVCQIEHKSAIRQPQSFLFRTAQNLALDHVKRAETRLTSSSDKIDETDFNIDTPPKDPTFDLASSEEEFAQFCEAVRRLPQQCRRAFVLKKVYGHTYREIANEMNISQNTVENYIALGVKRCELILDELQHAKNTTKPVASTPMRRDGAPLGGDHE